MNTSKRIFDIFISLVLTSLLSPIIALVAVLILIKDGKPIFYISERMKTPTQGFMIVKFRTMTPDSNDSGASGGHKATRITKIGKVLRKTRLDELPQLWNVLKGDISFVGPRPPLRLYVEKSPEIYAKVLRSRPGVTGLASVYFHEHEDFILSNSQSAEETEELYCNRCIPRKAHIDLLYQKNRNLCVDAMIMLKTVFKSLR